MKQIQVDHETYVIFDDKDLKLVQGHTWWVSISKTKRAVKPQIAVHTEINGKTVKMHRLIMNAPKGMDVDHIDGNGLNNRRSNLRICTRQQNLRNTGKYNRKNGTSSQFKGVSLNKKTGKWEAGLQFEGRRKYLGLFKTELEAAQAYNKAAIGCFGKFAKLNATERK